MVKRLQESELTVDRLREILCYDPDTGVFTWNISVSRNNKGAVAGAVTDRYVRIGIGNRLFQAHRLAWFYTYGVWPKHRIDHINRDKTDNRIGNLRDIDSFGNCQNTGPSVRNTSGHKGVCIIGGRARAMIHSKGRSIYLGMFDKIEDAVSAYAAGAAKYHTHNPAASAA